MILQRFNNALAMLLQYSTTAMNLLFFCSTSPMLCYASAMLLIRVLCVCDDLLHFFKFLATLFAARLPPCYAALPLLCLDYNVFTLAKNTVNVLMGLQCICNMITAKRLLRICNSLVMLLNVFFSMHWQ